MALVFILKYCIHSFMNEKVTRGDFQDTYLDQKKVIYDDTSIKHEEQK